MTEPAALLVVAMRYTMHLARRRMTHPFPGIDVELVCEKSGRISPYWAATAISWLIETGKLRELAIGGVYVPTERNCSG